MSSRYDGLIRRLNGPQPDSSSSGQALVTALIGGFMEKIVVRDIQLCECGAKYSDMKKIAGITADAAESDFKKFKLTKQDILEILKKVYC